MQQSGTGCIGLIRGHTGISDMGLEAHSLKLDVFLNAYRSQVMRQLDLLFPSSRSHGISAVKPERRNAGRVDGLRSH